METVAFNSIGFTAALILNRLRNERALALGSEDKSRDEKNPGQKPEGSPERSGKKNPNKNREYIERRLAEIAEFERRIATGIKGRR